MSAIDQFNIIRGVTFRDYETHGMDKVEVCVQEGVITVSQFVPEEMSHWQALSLSAMLACAAQELAYTEGEALGGGK